MRFVFRIPRADIVRVKFSGLSMIVRRPLTLNSGRRRVHLAQARAHDRKQNFSTSPNRAAHAASIVAGFGKFVICQIRCYASRWRANFLQSANGA